MGLSRYTSTAIRKNPLPRIVAIHVSVMAALRGSGFRNAGTPLLMASTPVSATAPDENARMSSSGVSPMRAVPPVKSATRAWSVGRASRLPLNERTRPTTISAASERM